MQYLKNAGVGTRQTPQSEPMRPNQVENSAGGYAWAVDDWGRFERFLVLGSEGGSYYAGEQTLTRENAEATLRCIQADGKRAVETIVRISDEGRAPKNDPAIYALAMAAKLGDEPTRKAALDSLAAVCRIGTHLFTFCSFLEQFGGWGRATRRAVGAWYNRPPGMVAYQVAKYRQRNGWTHRDLLRLAHPKPDQATYTLFEWIAQRERLLDTPDQLAQLWEDRPELQILEAFERAQTAVTPKDTASLIREYPDLSREMLRPDHLGDPEVWRAMLESGMPQTALLRNLANMTRIGLLQPGSSLTTSVAEQLVDPERLSKARVHPVAVLAALITYRQGHGLRGSEWDPIGEIVDALDAAFYASFGNVEPTNRRLCLALDVSGSMGIGAVAGVAGLTPRIASAAMALITAATEPTLPTIVGFTTGLTPLDISPRQRLNDVVRAVSGLPFGGTDCSLPMVAAGEQGWEIDGFVTYTDSETWAGRTHPSQALDRYRREAQRPAKSAVVGMVSNGFSIADPDDAGQMDFVGFDTAAPQLLSDFLRA